MLVAMSGGVDSSVAAGLLKDAGHDVEGATMKLWGGDSDSGCCSVSDVEDARRVAFQLGITHHVFNFTQEFNESVVSHYVASHQNGYVPNPCIECNRHLKFDVFLDRALRLGFDAIATGHYARVERSPEGSFILARAKDRLKDQSYVLSMLTNKALSKLVLPLGHLEKSEVRQIAKSLSLRTHAKPDSQDVCFIKSDIGRKGFLDGRISFTPGTLYDSKTNEKLGEVESLELLTLGQRKGISAGTSRLKTPTRRFVTHIDLDNRRATVGELEDLMVTTVKLGRITWCNQSLEPGSVVQVQLSAHGQPNSAVFYDSYIELEEPCRKPAPGQTCALYIGDIVVGSSTILAS